MSSTANFINVSLTVDMILHRSFNLDLDLPLVLDLVVISYMWGTIPIPCLQADCDGIYYYVKFHQ